jgi:hypothetical protein
VRVGAELSSVGEITEFCLRPAQVDLRIGYFVWPFDGHLSLVLIQGSCGGVSGNNNVWN